MYNRLSPFAIEYTNSNDLSLSLTETPSAMLRGKSISALLAVLLMLCACSVLAQNSSSSTGNAAAAASSSTGITNNSSSISSSSSSSTGVAIANNITSTSSSSTGAIEEVAAAAPPAETKEDTYWKKLYDWLFFSEWTIWFWCTFALACLLVALLASGRYRTRKLQAVVDKVSEFQSETDGHVLGSAAFSTRVVDAHEAIQEGDLSCLPSHVDRKLTKYKNLASPPHSK